MLYIAWSDVENRHDSLGVLGVYHKNTIINHNIHFLNIHSRTTSFVTFHGLTLVNYKQGKPKNLEFLKFTF